MTSQQLGTGATIAQNMKNAINALGTLHSYPKRDVSLPKPDLSDLHGTEGDDEVPGSISFSESRQCSRKDRRRSETKADHQAGKCSFPHTFRP